MQRFTLGSRLRQCFLGLLAFTALSGITATLFGADAGKLAVVVSKQIELAICLDTSNSMDGLIGSAKMKLWDIVNELAKAKPTPVLRVALYSYGNDSYNPSTGWVRKEQDFTADLDKINEKLFGLRTNGGTEYVGRVTRDALEQLQWSSNPATLKMIFVCGNEPATQDPEVRLRALAETAVRRGVVINTIYCGPASHSEAQGWKEFADLSEGRYASIDQARGTVAIATPMDKELAELGVQLNSTYAFCGKQKEQLAKNQLVQDANSAQLGISNSAARAQTKGGALYCFGDNDLVERLKKDPKFDVKTVPVADLSDEMKKMTPAEREKHVKSLLAKREELQERIAELGKKREGYIQDQMKKTSSKADKAFDEAIRGVLREQSKSKGIVIPE